LAVVGETPASADSDASDATLMARVAAGDRSVALRELYRRYERRLYGLGIRLLGDPNLAEELVQETFVRLWRKAGQFDPDKGTASAFIFTAARRIAIDLWRRPSSRPFQPEAEDAQAPGDAMEGVLVGLTVRHALDSLSSAHREVLDLTYTQGLKQAEIAERLGVPLGTVKTRTYHALRGLKDALQEAGVNA
jgi:RNA polymerase sigma-70 factor (ECF subfamily)